MRTINSLETQAQTLFAWKGASHLSTDERISFASFAEALDILIPEPSAQPTEADFSVFDNTGLIAGASHPGLL